MTNFRNYVGSHTFDIGLGRNPRANRNIVLIGGLNGAGKTSLMEALRLCLYGSKGVSPRVSQSDYEKYVMSRVNRDALASGENHAAVDIEIIDDRNGVPIELRISRKWTIASRGRVHERLDLSSDGRTLELIPEESWEDLIASIIPLYVSRLFFFDGERIKDLASGEDSDQIFRDAIDDLLGIRKYDSLSKDLVTLKGLMKRRNLKDRDTQKILDLLQAEAEKLQSDISESVAAMDILEGKMQGLLVEQNGIEAEIKRRVKDSASSMGSFKSQIAELEAREKQIGDSVRDLCELSLPLLMASPVASKLLDQLRRERHSVEKTAARGFLRDVEWDLVTRMTKSTRVVKELSDRQVKVVERELKVLFESYIDELSEIDSDGQLHGLSTTDSSQLEYVLTSVRSESENRLRESLQERERLGIEINGLYKKLKGVSDGIIDKELARLGEIRSEIGSIQHEMGRVKEVRSRLESDLARKLDERRGLEEKLECADEDRLK
ncbi:MAG: AAA family ATPase, partial [Candidatus Sifarchaeia archaeon]